MNCTKTAIIAITLSLAASADTLYMTNTQGQLFRADSSAPSNITNLGTVSGLQAGESLLGIDFRPATGQLFGLGSSSRLYTVNTMNAAATQVGTAGAFSLSGTSFGFDFNPTVDRIRVVSNTSQDLRLNPNDGSLTMMDGNLNGATTSIVGSAYTNSFAGSTATTLYGINNATGALYIQDPPNAGTQRLVGSLGVSGTIASNVGFDIAYPGNFGYATLQTGSAGTGLYSINLDSGAATLITNLNGQSITGLAVTNIPEPSSVALFALGAGAAGLWARRRRRVVTQ